MLEHLILKTLRWGEDLSSIIIYDYYHLHFRGEKSLSQEHSKSWELAEITFELGLSGQYPFLCLLR